MQNNLKSLSSYKKEIKKSLQDQFLSQTLDNFAINYKPNRDKVFEQIEAKELISAIADCKDYVAEHLEELFNKFKLEAEKRGAIVHMAKNTQEANELIVKIADENKVAKIVKAKSMTCEETQLNEHLEKEGFIFYESDLGEWVVQIRQERPSHMVMPIIHLSRHQVADNLSELTGTEQDSAVKNLVKVARSYFRPKFIEADMGITGANFAVAQTGSIATVTNEGNARLVTTLPRVHVVLLGLDKLIPRVEDAMSLLQVLPRNATAQMLTSYVNWITGAGQNYQDNTKKVLHIIFLDNGRSAVAKDPVFSQVFRCVRCGACANVCPIYRLVGGHKMGYIYIGAIGLILTYLFHDKEKAKVLAQNCINCEACKNICAGKIDLPNLISEIRLRLDKELGSSMQDNLLGAVMKNRKLFHKLLKYAQFAQRPFSSGEAKHRHLPNIFLGKHGYKALPVLAPASFREKWENMEKEVQNPRFTVAIFSGCAQDFIYPEQLEACVKLLHKHKVAVEFPLEQSCCGLPLKMMGQQKALEEVCKQNVDAFATEKYTAIITLCASCASHLKHSYKKVLKDLPNYQEKTEEFSDKIIDYSSFIFDILRLTADDFSKSDKKVAYHSSCHLCRGLNVVEAPRELIKYGADYVKSIEEDTCCGFGGTYSVKFPEISAKILERKMDNIKKTTATHLVVDCPGCIMQLRGGLVKNKDNIEVLHISELLAKQMKLS